MLLIYFYVVKIPFSWLFFLVCLGTCSFPVPLNSQLPRVPAPSFPVSSLSLLWQEEGLLTPMNSDRGITVYHSPSY